MQASSLKFNIYNQKHFSNEPIVLENLIIMSRSLIFSYIKMQPSKLFSFFRGTYTDF